MKTYHIRLSSNTYTNDGLGLNAVPYSEKYKKGVRENTTDKTKTQTTWQERPDCGIYRKQEEFLLAGQQYELTEEERKQCPGWLSWWLFE